MKAGIFEAADIFVINKADTQGCRMLQSQLEMFLKTKPPSAGGWREPIVLTEAVNDKGTDGLVSEILKHREFLAGSGELQKRRDERARLELAQALENFLNITAYEVSRSPTLEKLAGDVARGRTNPYAATLEAARLQAQGKSAV
jgi:LAO/AO transport system kinase